MKPLKHLSLVLPVLVVLAAACSSAEDGTSSPTSANTVTLRGTAFEPATITIKVGQTVTWKWESGTHDVKSGGTCTANGTFSSGDPVSGATFEQKFDKAGTFDYFCSVHCADGMTGKVIVQ